MRTNRGNTSISLKIECHPKVICVFVLVGNGVACLTSEQCDKLVKHSLCLYGTCQCREGETAFTDDVTGTVYCAELLGDDVCSADDQCLGMYHSMTFAVNLQAAITNFGRHFTFSP